MQNGDIRTALALTLLLGEAFGLISQDPVSQPIHYADFTKCPVAPGMHGTVASVGMTMGLIPSTASLGGGQTQQFTASMTGRSTAVVMWSLSPNVGRISSNGLYTAPSHLSTTQSVTITATLVADPSKKATAIVSLYSAGTSRFPISGSFLTFYRNLSPQLWAKEFDDMRELDMNTVVVVAAGHLQSDADDPLGYSPSSVGLLYPSRLVPAAERPVTDSLEMILTLADQRDMSVHLGLLQTQSDWYNGHELTALREYNVRMAEEILQRYGSHASLRGWYFTQELWMNWIQYYGPAYYGITLLRDFVADMKRLDPRKSTSAAVVFKKTGYGTMPGLTPAELQSATTTLLHATRLDILMPQDGAGAEAGAVPLDDLGTYFSAMAAARNACCTSTILWSTIETFGASRSVSSDRYAPSSAMRIHQQVAAVRPYVTGYISWIFGNDLSPQATYYPVEASALNREYRSCFKPQVYPHLKVLQINAYYFSTPPSPAHSDTPTVPRLTDRRGGGYKGPSLEDWVGFPVETSRGVVRLIADLGTQREVHKVRALTQSWAIFGIYLPYRMSVEYSTDAKRWSAFGSTASFPANSPDFTVTWGEVSGSVTARYVRYTFSHVGWLFLSEIEILVRDRRSPHCGTRDCPPLSPRRVSD